MHDFEERLKRLESIAGSLRDGRIGIDEATTLFEEGIQLSRALDTELKAIEQRVEVLLDVDVAEGDDAPVEPFDGPE